MSTMTKSVVVDNHLSTKRPFQRVEGATAHSWLRLLVHVEGSARPVPYESVFQRGSVVGGGCRDVLSHGCHSAIVASFVPVPVVETFLVTFAVIEWPWHPCVHSVVDKKLPHC